MVFHLKKLQKEEQIKPKEIEEGNKKSQVKEQITKKSENIFRMIKKMQHIKIRSMQLKQCFKKNV